MSLLGSDLLSASATVRINEQDASQDGAGGTVLSAGAVIETDVPMLVTLSTGSRDNRFATDWNVSGGTFSGESANLGRQDVLITFLTGLDGILTGKTARLLNVTTHPASPDGWLPARYSGVFEVVAAGAGA